MNLKILILLVIPIVIVTSYILLSVYKTCSLSLEEAFVQETVQKYEEIAKLAYEDDGTFLKQHDAVSDANIPYEYNIYEHPMQKNEYEYTIISIYKKVLSRNPTYNELNKHVAEFASGDLNEDLLRTYLLNSSEYAMSARLQTDNINADLEYAYAKEDMLLMISTMYLDELQNEAPRIMLLPLRDIYMHLDHNKYMFRAFLIDENYPKFEKEVMTTKKLKKNDIYALFKKHFDINVIKLRANDIQKYDLLNKQEKGEPVALASNTGTKLEEVDSGVQFDDIEVLLEEMKKKV